MTGRLRPSKTTEWRIEALARELPVAHDVPVRDARMGRRVGPAGRRRIAGRETLPEIGE